MNKQETDTLNNWVQQREFWKSESADWLDYFRILIDECEMTFDEAEDFIEGIIGLTRSEYGE